MVNQVAERSWQSPGSFIFSMSKSFRGFRAMPLNPCCVESKRDSPKVLVFKGVLSKL